MSGRLGLAAQAPKEGEVWREKIRTLRGERCRTLVLRVIPERAEGMERETEWFVERTTPGGHYRSKMDDFLRENERDVPLADEPRAGYPLFAGEKAARLADPQFRCPEHDVPMVEGKCPERRCPWKIETLDAPRVTREMVTGPVGSSPAFYGDNLIVNFCALCGAAILAVGEEGCAIAAVPDSTERHRAWHDRLERLLVAKG